MARVSTGSRKVTKSRRYLWAPFKQGELVAGVLVLKIKKRGSSQKDFIYEGLYECCGTKDEISHLRLTRRQKRNQKTCFYCSRPWGKIQKEAEEPLSIPLPLWPVPGQKG